MYIRVIGLFSFTEILLSILAQAELMPESLLSIIAQLPPFAVIVWLWLQTDKRQREDNEKADKRQKEDNEKSREWLEHMLSVQRESIKEIYTGNTDFLNTLISQMEAKQAFTSDRVELLTQQLAINTATVNEIAKVDSVVSDLIDRLERK